jgi:F-type H+-transporting ATPase subunit epsilon
MAKIQLVIVTPETTTFDEPVDSVVLPLVDGEAGVLAGHAPMIGRLGPGELRAEAGSDVKRFYVDGGFAQIENNVVTVLPGRSVPIDQIDVAAAREALKVAQDQAADSPDLAALKEKSIAQARAQIRLSEKTG